MESETTRPKAGARRRRITLVALVVLTLCAAAGARFVAAEGAAIRLTLTIPANPAAPAQVYVFERVADAALAAATPGAGSAR